MNATSLIRKDLQNKTSYIREDISKVIRLHANELPWSAPTASQADLNHYPNAATESAVRDQLAKYYAVKPEQLLMTRGSSEGIDLIIRLFLQAREDSLMQFPPTFSLYELYCQLQQVAVINCPVDAEFNVTFDNIVLNWQPNCKIILLCRPNNPTGNVPSFELIQQLCDYFQGQAMIVVDEAYIEFSDSESTSRLIADFDNLIVLRTLSKACGLAGLRLGCVLSQAGVISALDRILAPFALSTVVVDSALTALSDLSWLSDSVARIKQSRDELLQQLAQLSFVTEVYPSQGNFILIKVDHLPAILEALTASDIRIRTYSNPPSLKDHMRISIGSAVENQILMNVLQNLERTV